MVMRPLFADLEGVFVDSGEEVFVGSSAVHERMAWRIDLALLVRVEDFEGRRQVFGQDRKEVEEEWGGIVREESEDCEFCVILMHPISLLAR